MALLPDAGTAAYNGVSFTTLFHSKIETRPVPDESGRTTKWVEHLITIEGKIGGTSTAVSDDEMEEKRKLLTVRGGALNYVDKGFGDLNVNGNSPVKDVNFGPHPRILSWMPLGNSGVAANVVWEVLVTIPECDGARYKGVAEFCYSYGVDIDPDGYTTRTIAGHILIASERFGHQGRKLRRTVDEFKEQITPPPIVGYRRERNDWNVELNKTRATFTFVDRQQPRANPDKVSTITCRHRLRSKLRGNENDPFDPKGFRVWGGALTATITPQAGEDPSYALDAFMLLFNNRVTFGRARAGAMLFAAGLGAAGAGPGAARVPANVFLTALDVDEEVHGGHNPTTFTADYILIGPGLVHIFAQSGLWRPITGTSFVSWQQSLLPVALHPRGQAKMALAAKEDTIVDLCLPEKLEKPQGPTRSLLEPNPGRPDDNHQPPPKLVPEASWLAYENFLNLITIPGTVAHKLLPPANAPDDMNGGANAALDPIGGDNAQLGGGAGAFARLTRDQATPEAPPKRPDVVQERTGPSYRIQMTGQAARLLHPIPIPRLVKVGGKDVIEHGRSFISNKVIGAIAGIPLRRAYWVITYVLAEPFKGMMPDLKNPTYDTPGGQP